MNSNDDEPKGSQPKKRTFPEPSIRSRRKLGPLRPFNPELRVLAQNAFPTPAAITTVLEKVSFTR